jgi:hypothetical protein
MNMILHDADTASDLTVLPAVPQFQQVSPTALRQRISELTTAQDELKERLRRQEQATRNAIGVGVLGTILAAASIAVTLWTTTAETRSGNALARPGNPAQTVSPPDYSVMASMR